MTHRLATNYAKNYCNRTPTVKVIVEYVVTCFLGTRCTMQHQCNVHGAMSTANVMFDEILCWVDNYRQPYNALPTGIQENVSSLAQWGAN